MSEWNDETAEWYANKYGEYATNRLAVDALDIHDRSVLVDVGCGAGAALRHAASRVTQGTLIWIDPVPRMIEIARERALSHPHGAGIEFRQGTAEELPVDDDFPECFDPTASSPSPRMEAFRVVRKRAGSFSTRSRRRASRCSESRTSSRTTYP